MSDPDSPGPGSAEPTDSEPPKETPAPPPAIKTGALPAPDGFADINRASQIAREKAQAEKKNARQRRHPKDPYEKLKPHRASGCGGCFVVLLILIALPIGGAAYWMKQEHADLTTNQGFTPVRVQEKNVTEAPAGKTLYVGGQVLYEVPETQPEVAFMGGSWWLSGTFHEKVTFRGAQLILEPGSHFMKGLDVRAVKLDTGNAIIDGEITGKILQQTASPGE